jgi:Tfp pilus assembly protein PilO
VNRQTTLLGVLAAVLVVALWWFLLYAPGSDELAQAQSEIDAAQSEQSSLQQRIAALETVRSRAPETEAAIATIRSFVPDDPALPGALRQIQAAADDAGIDLTAVATTRPEPIQDDPAAMGLHAAAVTLTAEGSYFQLVDFLRRVEDPEITARGIVFNVLTLATAEYPTLTASISGEMYALLDPVPEPVGGDGTTAPAPSPSPTATEGDDA